MFRDLIQLWDLVFYREPKQPKAPKSRPKSPPPSPPNGPNNRSVNVSKKERIIELEAEIHDLKRDSENMNDLMVKMAKELAELKRAVAPLLPEE